MSRLFLFNLYTFFVLELSFLGICQDKKLSPVIHLNLCWDVLHQSGGQELKLLLCSAQFWHLKLT